MSTKKKRKLDLFVFYSSLFILAVEDGLRQSSRSSLPSPTPARSAAARHAGGAGSTTSSPASRAAASASATRTLRS